MRRRKPKRPGAAERIRKSGDRRLGGQSGVGHQPTVGGSDRRQWDSPNEWRRGAKDDGGGAIGADEKGRRPRRRQ